MLERNFGTAKEHHGMRYTQMNGKAKIRMKVAFTFMCMNMKKLARLLIPDGPYDPEKPCLHGLIARFCLFGAAGATV